MRSKRIATICLAIMILIALVSWKPAHLSPITSLDTFLKAAGDQTDLMKTLHQAERASRGQ